MSYILFQMDSTGLSHEHVYLILGLWEIPAHKSNHGLSSYTVPGPMLDQVSFPVPNPPTRLEVLFLKLGAGEMVFL